MLSRAFDNICTVFVALLPTLTLSFGAKALIDSALLPITDPPPVITQSEPQSSAAPNDASLPNESIDAAVTAASIILQIDNIEIEWDILDRTEQCCPYHSHYLHHKSPRWREDW